MTWSIASRDDCSVSSIWHRANIALHLFLHFKQYSSVHNPRFLVWWIPPWPLAFCVSYTVFSMLVVTEAASLVGLLVRPMDFPSHHCMVGCIYLRNHWRFEAFASELSQSSSFSSLIREASIYPGLFGVSPCFSVSCRYELVFIMNLWWLDPKLHSFPTTIVRRNREQKRPSKSFQPPLQERPSRVCGASSRGSSIASGDVLCLHVFRMFNACFKVFYGLLLIYIVCILVLLVFFEDGDWIRVTRMYRLGHLC